MVETPGLSVGYLALNSAKPPHDNIKVRQAVAHALNVPGLLTAKYGPSAEAAEQFTPPGLWGRAPDPARYGHDPARARQLIAESASQDFTVEFWYPTTSIGPALPDAESVFLAFKADLENVGFTVVAKPVSSLGEYFGPLSEGWR